LDVIKQAKAAAVQNHIKQGEKTDKEITKEVEQIKKIENSGLRDDARQKLEGDVKEADLPPYEIMNNLDTKTEEEKKSVRLPK